MGETLKVLGKDVEANKYFQKANELDPLLIWEEKAKDSEKEIKKVQDFQEILKELEATHQKDEGRWLLASFFSIAIVIGIFFGSIFFFQEQIDTFSHIFINLFTFATVFIIVRQYTNAKALRIEASNRVAMAKMFENVKDVDAVEYKEYMGKIMDTIVYSTRQDIARNNNLPEHFAELVKAIKALK